MLKGNTSTSSVAADCESPRPVLVPQPPTTLVNLALIRSTGPPDPGGPSGLASAGTTQLLTRISSPSHCSDASINNENQQKQSQDNNNNNNNHQHHHHHSNNNNNTSSQSNSIGHYELKRTLGKGNFSTVKLAQHKITHHSVAIKIVKFSALSDDNLMKINREIDVLKKLGRHKHIVRLYQVIKTKRYFFLITEFCANGELYDYLVDKGRLNEQQSCKYFQQILSAVEYLHDHNIVHRDLKAENLLLTDNHETVKIADFGFANYFKQDNLLSTWCGSPPYAAPELFNGLLYTGPPVDIWSMGVILYVLVCGSLPFDGHNLVHLKSRVTSGKFRIPFFMTTECESLIRGMLRLDPDRRFGIRQIRAHCWTQKYAAATTSSSFTNSANNGKEASRTRNGTYTTTTTTTTTTNNNNNNNNNDSNRGQRQQSLESDVHSDNNNNTRMDISVAGVTATADTSMSCLTSASDADGARAHKLNAALDTRSGSKISPTSMRNFVDTEIVNAVSNMSIDSNNSSISQGMDITNATFSNHSGCASSLSNSRYSGTPARTDSSCANNIRQFSKESSIDDQIIDFMVDNLKIADNQSSIRQSIANDKYDDLHAIYRLLRDQPDMVLEAKFKIPSLPLISPNRDEAPKKPSITTGFFNFTQIHNNNNNNQHQQPNQQQPARDRIEPQGVRASFSGQSSRRDSAALQQLSTNFDDLNKAGGVATNLLDTIHRSCDNRFSCAPTKDSSAADTGSEEPSNWQVPPQLFLTPPIEGAKGAHSSKTVDHFACFNEDASSSTRHSIARHSFDSAIIGNNRSNDVSPPAGFGLNRDSLWDSSMLDTQGASMTPTTPVKLGDSILSATFSDANTGQDEQGMRLVQNLATITTNLPQIGAYSGTANAINHNLLLAQLNSTGCNAAMTQSGLLTQHEPVEQSIPLKFTPNNLVNQNYNVMNNLAIQNTLKIPGVPNLSLLDPEGLASGLERRASDGQANYNSLTTTTTNSTSTTTAAPLATNDGTDKTQQAKQCDSTVASQQQLAYQRSKELTAEATTTTFSPSASASSSSSNQILSTSMDSNSQVSGAVYHDRVHYVDLFGRAHNQQFQSCDYGLTGASSSVSSSAVKHPGGDFTSGAVASEQASGPLDLSKKMPNYNMRSCDIGEKRDGLKRVSNQRSNSTTSYPTAVCFQNLSHSSTTSSSPKSPVLATNSTVTAASNNGIPFCHASKRAKKLHQN